LTDDHVFIRAVGGKATVKACKPCNDWIGHSIEGALQRSDQLLNLIKLGQGSGLPLRGTIQATGDEIEHNLLTGEVHARHPVTTTVAGDQTTYNVRGSPEQVEAVLRQMAKTFGWEEATVQQLLASGEQVDLGNSMLDTKIVTDRELAGRLASKVALGAGCAAFGEAFLSSSLAADLRAVMRGAVTGVSLVSADLLPAFDLQISSFPPLAGKVAPITPNRAENRSEVIFCETNTGAVIFVYLAGVLIATGGLLYNHVLSVGHHLPVVFTDGPGKMSVRLLADEIAGCV
jgi:uncharacterized protein YfiM (DUF2279 family)